MGLHACVRSYQHMHQCCLTLVHSYYLIACGGWRAVAPWLLVPAAAPDGVRGCVYLHCWLMFTPGARWMRGGIRGVWCRAGEAAALAALLVACLLHAWCCWGHHPRTSHPHGAHELVNFVYYSVCVSWHL